MEISTIPSGNKGSKDLKKINIFPPLKTLYEKDIVNSNLLKLFLTTIIFLQTISKIVTSVDRDP